MCRTASALTGMDPPVLTFVDPQSARLRADVEMRVGSRVGGRWPRRPCDRDRMRWRRPSLTVDLLVANERPVRASPVKAGQPPEAGANGPP